LQELIACGFVKPVYPINKTKEDVLYRLVDEYTIFYFKFIADGKGSIRWLDMFNTNIYKVWCGYAFENVCLRHTESIKTALGIAGVLTSAYSWQHKGDKTAGAQIDLLLNRNDNCINLFEAKFYNAPYEVAKQYADAPLHKKSVFAAKTKTRKNIFITLITPYGCEVNKYCNSIVTNQLKADDLFR
jgi:uncharacterized protein